jgi:hypothetical protein
MLEREPSATAVFAASLKDGRTRVVFPSDKDSLIIEEQVIGNAEDVAREDRRGKPLKFARVEVGRSGETRASR